MTIKQILYISIMVTTFAFIGYNVLTAEASEIKDVCKQMDGEWKDNECKFKDGVEMGKPYSKEQYQVDFDHTLEEEGLWDKYAAEQEDKKYKNICDDVDGKWTKDGCETDHDGPKADKFEEKVTELHQQEQESEPEQIEDWRNTVEEKGPEQIMLEEWEEYHGSPGFNHEIPSTSIVELNNNDDEDDKKDDVAAADEYEEEESDESSEEDEEESEEEEDSGGGEDEE